MLWGRFVTTTQQFLEIRVDGTCRSQYLVGRRVREYDLAIRLKSLLQSIAERWYYSENIFDDISLRTLAGHIRKGDLRPMMAYRRATWISCMNWTPYGSQLDGSMINSRIQDSPHI